MESSWNRLGLKHPFKRPLPGMASQFGKSPASPYISGNMKTKKPKNTSGPKRSVQPRAGERPTREQLLEALAQDADIKGKRDLAKVFGIRGDMRRPFKAMLAELEGEGVITRTRKALRRTAALPHVTVLDIPSDADPDAL